MKYPYEDWRISCTVYWSKVPLRSEFLSKRSVQGFSHNNPLGRILTVLYGPLRKDRKVVNFPKQVRSSALSIGFRRPTARRRHRLVGQDRACGGIIVGDGDHRSTKGYGDAAERMVFQSPLPLQTWRARRCARRP